MDASSRWVITTSGDRPISDVAVDVAAAGFAMNQVLEVIGIITGSATDGVAEAVRAVPGLPTCRGICRSTSVRRTPTRLASSKSTVRLANLNKHTSTRRSP